MIIVHNKKREMRKSINYFHAKPFSSENEQSLNQFILCPQYDQFVTGIIQHNDSRAQKFTSAIEKETKMLVNKKA